MDGTETRSQVNRCRIFDMVWSDGPLKCPVLARRLRLRLSEVRRLVEYEWFCGEKDSVSLVRLRGPFDGG